MNLHFRKNISLIALGLALVVPSLVFGQATEFSPPENGQEAQHLGQNALNTAQKEGPGTIGRIWQNEVLPVWQKMLSWADNNIWEPRLKPWLQSVWTGTLRILRIEVKNRTPAAKEKFQEEKTQVQEEAPKVGKSFWDKFMDIIR